MVLCLLLFKKMSPYFLEIHIEMISGITFYTMGRFEVDVGTGQTGLT